jgi:hypothetical protein
MTECRMTKEFPNDEPPRGVILGFRIFVIPSSFGFRHLPAWAERILDFSWLGN